MSIRKWLKDREPLIPHTKIVDMINPESNKDRISKRINELEHQRTLKKGCNDCQKTIDSKIESYRKRLKT